MQPVDVLCCDRVELAKLLQADQQLMGKGRLRSPDLRKQFHVGPVKPFGVPFKPGGGELVHQGGILPQASRAPKVGNSCFGTDPRSGECKNAIRFLDQVYRLFGLKHSSIFAEFSEKKN